LTIIHHENSKFKVLLNKTIKGTTQTILWKTTFQLKYPQQFHQRSRQVKKTEIAILRQKKTKFLVLNPYLIITKAEATSRQG
jgi:hypothetical protein